MGNAATPRFLLISIVFCLFIVILISRLRISRRDQTFIFYLFMLVWVSGRSKLGHR